ncbi:MAG TPA: hypothetical protein VLT58_11390, partial [Polyangia bacterium]|nr:hypothetical protein [Polyangia bacterium]
ESFHEPLLALGRDAGQTAVLIDRLLALVEPRRRNTETGVAAVLLLRVAEIAERDLGDDARALDLLRRADEVEPRSLAVLTGLGHLAQKRGDSEECERIAARLTELAAAGPGDAAEALYRAAALELPLERLRDGGIAKLCAALEKNPDLERASALVQAAGLAQSELVKILPLYERIARQSGDERLLLDYLERRATTPAITVAEAREAVDLAVALGESDRVDPLLVKLAEIGAKDPAAAGRRNAAWASLELVQRKKSSGDLEGAAQALERAAASDVVDPEKVGALARELADRAAKAGHHRLGAALLERLRARAPGDESVWHPLLAHYVALHDRAALDRVVEETLPLLPEVDRRNQLRLARAQVLLGDDERDPAAAEILRDMLFDEPRNAEALALLSGYYERSGAEDDLRDLLEQRFEAAVEARDADDVAAAALRLGRLLETLHPERDAALYELALGVAKGRRQLLERLIAVRGAEATPDYAKQMEELLDVETGPEAVGLVRELAAIWSKLGDPAGVRRVLERGHELAPADADIAGELEALYRTRKSWCLLAGLLNDRAKHEPNAAHAVSMLTEAATLQ